MADTHLLIAKEFKDGRTTTHVTPLSKQDKVAEIGRMIAGVEVTDLTKRHAQELLKQAGQVKRQDKPLIQAPYFLFHFSNSVSNVFLRMPVINQAQEGKSIDVAEKESGVG